MLRAIWKGLEWRLSKWVRMVRQATNLEDIGAALRFLFDSSIPVGMSERLRLVRACYVISFRMDAPHRQSEVLAFIAAILRSKGQEPGVFVEAGCYKGASTAKFSLAAAMVGRKLHVFDSFEGLPENQEQHGRSIFGEVPDFSRGKYAGALQEVQANIAKFGNLAACEFHKGWFENSMVGFSEPCLGVYLDVDLVSSTKTCIQRLYGLIVPGGVLMSQDGHLPLIIKLFSDAGFWRDEIGVEPPVVGGLGTSKRIWTTKNRHVESGVVHE